MRAAEWTSSNYGHGNLIALQRELSALIGDDRVAPLGPHIVQSAFDNSVFSQYDQMRKTGRRLIGAADSVLFISEHADSGDYSFAFKSSKAGFELRLDSIVSLARNLAARLEKFDQ